MATLLLSSLVWLLLFFLVCAVTYYAVDWVLGKIGIPQLRQIVLVVLGILALIVLLEHFIPLLGSTGGHL